MSPGVRRLVFLVGAAGLAALLLAGLTALPPTGHGRSPLGDAHVAAAVQERHAANVVAVIVADLRGFDTVCEEFILFTAVMGVSLLLRTGRTDEDVEAARRARTPGPPYTSDAMRGWALGLVAPTLVLGLSIVAHGHLTPGGGFQGGVVLGGALVLVHLGGVSLPLRRVEPAALWDTVEGVGAGGFALLGVLGVLEGRPYLTNVLPLGQLGALLSVGLVPVANLCIGTAVSAGLILILFEFFEQTLFARQGAGR